MTLPTIRRDLIAKGDKAGIAADRAPHPSGQGGAA